MTRPGKIGSSHRADAQQVEPDHDVREQDCELTMSTEITRQIPTRTPELSTRQEAPPIPPQARGRRVRTDPPWMTCVGPVQPATR